LTASQIRDQSGLHLRAVPPPPELHDPLPAAEVITMGMILYAWNLETEAAPDPGRLGRPCPGGVFICIEPLIGDARRPDAFAFALSLSFAQVDRARDAFGFTAADWCSKIGCERVDILPRAEPMTAGLAHKERAA
jgi:hypothetical protein